MIAAIPTQASAARGLRRAPLVLVVLACAAAAGAFVNGWRLDAAHAEALNERDATINRRCPARCWTSRTRPTWRA